MATPTISVDLARHLIVATKSLWPSSSIEVRLAALPEPDLTDPDNPEWTQADFARAVRPEQLSAAELAAFPFTRAVRGPQRAPTKRLTSLRVDADVVEGFKASGPGWQSRINETLRRALRAES